MQNTPAFGPVFFAVDAIDMHAARVELRHGGSGIFNHSEPQLSLLVRGRSYIEAAGVRAWIEPGMLVYLPAGPRLNVVNPDTVCYSVGLGEEQPQGKDAVMPVIGTVRGRSFREWHERMEALRERPITDRTELASSFAPLMVAAAERRARHRYTIVREFFAIVERQRRETTRQCTRRRRRPGRRRAPFRRATRRSAPDPGAFARDTRDRGPAPCGSSGSRA